MHGQQTVDATAIRAAVDIFYERMTSEPAFAAIFAGVDLNRLKGHQRAFLLQVLGGPSLYSGRELKTAHAGLEITDAHYEIAIEHLLDALVEVGVAPDVVERAAGDIEGLRALIVAA